MKFDGTNLEEVLERHSKWFNEEVGTTEEDRADFSNCNMREALFGRSNLYGANFRNADVSDSVFVHCDLRKADFTDAKMRDVCLYKSQTTGAKMWIPLNCPDTGSFIAWKKCLKVIDGEVGTIHDPVLLKLLIPEDALRTNTGNDRSCKASKAKVLEFQNIDGTSCKCDYAVSIKNRNYKYLLGETVVADGYQNNDSGYLHGPGIYFYITRQEAAYYMDLTAEEWINIKNYKESLDKRLESRGD